MRDQLLVKVSETTRKRQSIFYLTAITYVLVYVFSVSVTGVQEVGLKVNLPEEFAPSLLFVTSTFLGLRYFIDIWGDANFLQWVDVEDKKIRDLNNGIEQCNNFLILVSADLTPYSRSLFTNSRPLCLSADLSNLRSQLAFKIREGSLEDAIAMLQENRSWVEHACKAAIRDLKRKRMITYLGITNVVSVLIFDIILPVILFLSTVYIWFCQPAWLKYATV